MFGKGRARGKKILFFPQRGERAVTVTITITITFTFTFTLTLTVTFTLTDKFLPFLARGRATFPENPPDSEAMSLS